MTKIFIYGTLKKGFTNNHHLFDASHGTSTFICNAKTKEKYALIIDKERWYLPFLLDSRGTGHCVRGEVYEVDATMLQWLDRFEDVGEMYDVLEVDVQRVEGDDITGEEGDVMKCLCYVMHGTIEKYLRLPHLENYTQEDAQHYCEEDVDI